MTKRKLGPVLLAAALGIAAGCHRQYAQAAGPSTPGQNGAPAPFAAPPVLPGTPDVASLVAKVTTGVVNITTIHDIRAPQQQPDFDFPFGFDPFGGGVPRGRRRGGGDQVYRQRALGSGFIIDPAGYVITNAHVVEEADTMRVKLSDEREFEAKVKGRDPKLDLAVLELVGARDLPAVSLGSSDALRVGEYVVAIGNPFGLGNTVTMGIVSAKSRSIGAGLYDDFIQTDASINPGNSGGPLFNLRGQVIGINTAINPHGQGIGFAIPVDALKDILPQLLSTGKVARGRLGVAIQSVDLSLAKALGLDRPKGALVGEVEPGGPADRAGLRAGDLIVRINQVDVGRSEDLPRAVARNLPGSKVKVEFLRERTSRTVDVTLDELRDEPRGRQPAPGGAPGRGSSAPTDRGSLEPGDVVLEVNRTPVARASEVTQRFAAAPSGKPVLLKIRRENATRFVAIEQR